MSPPRRWRRSAPWPPGEPAVCPPIALGRPDAVTELRELLARVAAIRTETSIR